MSKRIYSKKSEKLAKSAGEGWMRGLKLKDLHEVGKLEEKLRRDHTQVVTRCTLLGFYCSPKYEGNSRHDSNPKHDSNPNLWCENFEWLIKNCPDELFMSTPDISRIPESVSSEQFEELQAVFLQKVDRNRNNANVTGNAGHFIYQRNKKLAVALFKRARKLAPDDSRWSEWLLFGYAKLAKDSKDQKLAEKAFKVADKRIDDLKERNSHGWHAMWMCSLALRFNDLERAKKYVKEMKKSKFDRAHPWFRHQLFGLLALNVEISIGHRLLSGHIVQIPPVNDALIYS